MPTCKSGKHRVPEYMLTGCEQCHVEEIHQLNNKIEKLEKELTRLRHINLLYIYEDEENKRALSFIKEEAIPEMAMMRQDIYYMSNIIAEITQCIRGIDK